MLQDKNFDNRIRQKFRLVSTSMNLPNFHQISNDFINLIYAFLGNKNERERFFLENFPDINMDDRLKFIANISQSPDYFCGVFLEFLNKRKQARNVPNSNNSHSSKNGDQTAGAKS